MKYRFIIVSILAIVLVVFATGCGESGTEMTLDLAYGEKIGTYDGEVNENGLPEGTGSFSTENSEGVKWIYTGEFVNGHFEGKGEITWENGQKEIGTYHNDVLKPEPKKNIKKMYRSPDEYKYHCFEITGLVFNVVGYSDGYLQFQIYEDIDKTGNNTVVLFEEDMDLSQGDYVRIKGISQGSIDYENVVGGNVSAVAFLADSVEKISYKEAAAPTKKKVKVNKSDSHYGYKVTVKKVEFAEKETRVYVRVDNGGNYNVHFFDFNSIAVQGGKQYSTEENYMADYPELETDLRPGNNTEGVVVFPKLKKKDFSFIITGYSDSGWESMQEYKIDIKVN